MLEQTSQTPDNASNADAISPNGSGTSEPNSQSSMFSSLSALLLTEVLPSRLSPKMPVDLENHKNFKPPSPLDSLRVVGEVFKHLWNEHKGFLGITATCSVAAGSLPMAVQWLSAKVPSLLQGQFNAMGNSFAQLATTAAQLVPAMETTAAIAFLVWAASSLIGNSSGIAHTISETATNKLAPALERHLRQLHSRFNQLLPYDEMLGAENKDLSSKVDQSLWSYRWLFNNSIKFGVGVVVTATTAAAVLSSNPYLGAALGASLLPLVVGNILRARERSIIEQGTIYEERGIWTTRSFATDPNTMLTTRELNSTPKLFENYVQRDVAFQNKRWIADARTITSDIITQFGALGGTLFCAGIIIHTGVAAQTALSSMLFDLGLVAAFQGGLASLSGTFGQLYSATCRLQPFFTMNKRLEELEAREAQKIKLNLDTPPTITLTNVVVTKTTEESSQTILEVPLLKLEPGTILGICGPIGGGKSTLAKLIAGMERPASGLVNVQVGDESYDLNEISLESWASIVSYLPQNTNILDLLSVAENVQLGQNKRLGGLTLGEVDPIVGLSEVVGHAPKGLDSEIGWGWHKGYQPSGGQMHVMALGRALISNTPVLILDEPTANLDPKKSEEFRIRLEALVRKSGKSAIIISHSFGDLDFADKVAVIENGKMQEPRPPKDLLGSPGFYRDGNATLLNSMARKIGFEFIVGEDGRLIPVPVTSK